MGGLSLALGQAGVAILSLTPELATLEDLFFRLTENNGAGETEAPPALAAPVAAEERLVEAP